MHLVSSLDSARPTWARFFATLAVGSAVVLGAINTFAAQPAHLAKGLQLVDEITAAVTAPPNACPRIRNQAPSPIRPRWECPRA